VLVHVETSPRAWLDTLSPLLLPPPAEEPLNRRRRLPSSSYISDCTALLRRLRSDTSADVSGRDLRLTSPFFALVAGSDAASASCSDKHVIDDLFLCRQDCERQMLRSRQPACKLLPYPAYATQQCSTTTTSVTSGSTCSFEAGAARLVGLAGFALHLRFRIADGAQRERHFVRAVSPVGRALGRQLDMVRLQHHLTI